MKRVATAVVLIPLVIAAVIFSPNWLFTTLLALVALISLTEFLRLAKALGNTPRLLPYVFVALIFSVLVVGPAFRSSSFQVMAFLPAALLLFPLVILAWGIGASDFRQSVHGGSLALLGTYYITVPLLCLALMREQSFVGNYFLILLFVVVWGGDIGALYVGRLIGRHYLAPRVSPGKTWEGAVASVVFATILSCVVTQWLGPRLSGTPASKFFGPNDWATTISLIAPPLWVPILFAVIVNVSAQIGDLAESMLKRAANVKDSGALLPGHGGMLDRIDALLFAAPMGMLVFLFVEQFFSFEPDVKIFIKP